MKRRDWGMASMFPMGLGVLLLFPHLMLWMGINERYNPKTGKFVEHTHPPLWPFDLVAIALILTGAVFCYLSWRGRSQLTYSERVMIEDRLKKYVEFLDHMDKIVRDGLTSGKGGTSIDDPSVVEIFEENERERKITKSALSKVDNLL